MFVNNFTVTVFHAHDATSQSLRCANAITLIMNACQNMSLYVKAHNMLMPSFASVCVLVCLSSLCLLPILSSPNLYSGQVGSSTDLQLSN